MYSKVLGKNNNKGNAYAGGVETAIEDTSFPKDIMEAAATVEAAIPRTVFADDKQLNAVCALLQKLRECECMEGLQTLLDNLNGRPAIGGFRTVQAIMAHVGLIAPEAFGVKLGKDTQKFIREQIESRRRQSPGENGDED